MRIPKQTQTTANQQAQKTDQAASTAQTSTAQQPGDIFGGSPNVGQTTPVTPVICPQPIGDLSPAELERVASVGGEGIRGNGTLRGEIGLMKIGEVNGWMATLSEKPVLITSGKGTPDQVHFVLDIPPSKARALEGKQVDVSGLIDKDSATTGKITGANVAGQTGFKAGDWTPLSGKIENRQLFGPGGEAPPSGAYLVLDTSVEVDGKSVSAIFVGGAKTYPEGTQVTLNGRLDQGSYGGVETPPRSYVQLTGVTDLTAGEPSFDGQKFTNDAGKTLPVLSYNRPMLADAPARIWVLDQGNDTAFLGSSGGFVPPWVNPFHGFRAAKPIDYPTQTDRDSIAFNDDGQPFVKATGDKLALIGQDSMPPDVADGMGHSWYLDPKTDTAYRFANGGIAGFSNFMDQIVRGE